MGTVVVLHNPFDPFEREVHRTRRPMTVRRFVARTQKKRTVVRTVNGRRVRVFVRPTVCFFNGMPLLHRDWHRRTIAEGDIVAFSAQAGGGGSNPLQIIMMVAAIAIVVAAPYLAAAAAPFMTTALGVSFAAGTIGGSILTATIGIALSAALYGVMSILTPPPPSAAGQGNVNSGYGGSPQSSPTYSLQAQGNSARLGQPIPVLYGRHMVYPDFVSEPYVRYIDNKQYIHVLLGVTQGECEIEQVRVGDTPVESFKSIEWAPLEPGEEPDTEIVDPRWLVCRDIADIELLGADADPASPWTGPFASNPAGTIVDTIEVDFVSPRGLFKSNASGTYDGKSVTFEIQAIEIDDNGEEIGSWSTVDTVTKSASDSAPQRYTETYELAEGRWQIRVRRTDSKDASAYAGHEIHWVGLRGRILEQRRFDNMTCLQVKMEATGDLNGQTSRRVNVIATRKLPTWDDDTGAMTTGAVATRNPIDAIADIARNQIYGGRIADTRIDLATMYSHWYELERVGWTFDFVFDQTRTVFDAINLPARATIGVAMPQGGKIRLVRDLPNEAPVTVFTPRNIKKGSLKIEYKMVDEQTADALVGTYMSETAWKPVPITVAFPDSAQARPATMKFEGMTQRDQVRAVLWRILRANRYQRRVLGWDSEMEGLPLLYGDRVSLSHDVPRWGQAAELTDWDEDTRTATLSEELVHTAGATHYIALRKPDGTLAGPFVATAGAAANQVIIGEGELPALHWGGDRERTYVQFGPGEEYSKRLIVIQMRPRSNLEATLVAIDDDPRMYEEIPDDVAAPIGAPVTPLAVSISADAANVNLRTLADDAGYSGLRSQAVTFTIEAGVELYSTSALTAAVVRGSWPFSVRPKLINLGTMTGTGGAGGDGGPGDGLTFAGNGQKGGDALDSSSGPLELDNSAGVIRAGGGGGGGGGAAVVHQPEPPNLIGGGGGGGGGQGRVAGSTGSGKPSAGSSPTPGSPGSGTTGGAGGLSGDISPVTGQPVEGGTGGNGGAYGTAGSGGAGAAGSGGDQGLGGAAGRAIKGVANVAFDGAPGTITGPQV